MPVKAFEEFCAHHQVQHLSTDDFAKIEYDRMKWRFGHCCKVSDEAAFCLIQRPYISKTLLT
ncbi:phenol hydroxylase subunit, partial [Escherichia coli]|uniref:phenol hydroxylase subunit n=1 Tax=Escherichia coli TaxID=562 RepID=UPI00201EFA71